MKVRQEIRLDDGGRIVMFDLYSERNEISAEEYAANVKRLSPDGTEIWQLRIPPRERLGETWRDTMVYMEDRSGKLMVTSFNGFVYEVDWTSGAGVLVDFSK